MEGVDGDEHEESAGDVQEETDVSASPPWSDEAEEGVGMIYGSPEAEMYFRQMPRPTDESTLVVEVDDLCGPHSTELIVRPLPEAEEEAEEEGEREESDLYTDQEDEENKSHAAAAARVASALNDVHRNVSDGDGDGLDERARRMAEAIVASAMFETVFLQPDPVQVPFIGSSLCRVHIPSYSAVVAGTPPLLPLRPSHSGRVHFIPPSLSITLSNTLHPILSLSLSLHVILSLSLPSGFSTLPRN